MDTHAINKELNQVLFRVLHVRLSKLPKAFVHLVVLENHVLKDTAFKRIHLAVELTLEVIKRLLRDNACEFTFSHLAIGLPPTGGVQPPLAPPPAPGVIVLWIVFLRRACLYVACSTAKEAALFAEGGGVGVGMAGCVWSPPPPICC
jgi:hypothetical protein